MILKQDDIRTNFRYMELDEIGYLNEGEERRERMLQKIIHFNLKEGKAKEFENWILKNQENYAKALPQGHKYLGCYFTVFNIGRFDFQIRYQIDNFAALDTLRAYEDKEFNKLLTEAFDFINPNFPMEIEIVRSVEEVKIKGERK